MNTALPNTDSSAYDGVTVLDLSQGFAGPYASSLLAASGATVNKLEPLYGDWSRRIGRKYDGLTAFNLAANTGKRSISADLQSLEGREVALELIRGSDVVVTNFLPEAAKRLQLTTHDLKTANPDVITMTVLGLGFRGEAAKRPAVDSVLQGWSGLASLLTDNEGKPGRLGFAAIDAVTAVYVSNVIGAALYRKLRTGVAGDYSVSLMEAALAFQTAPIVDAALADGGPQTGQSRTPLAVPSGVFSTEDGFLILSCINDRMYAGLASALDLDTQLVERTMSGTERLKAAVEVNAAVATKISARPGKYWVERLSKQNVPCGPVLSYSDILYDPTVAQAELLTSLDHGTGSINVPRSPGDQSASGYASPHLGQHTSEILGELGYESSAISRLKESRVVFGLQ